MSFHLTLTWSEFPQPHHTPLKSCGLYFPSRLRFNRFLSVHYVFWLPCQVIERIPSFPGEGMMKVSAPPGGLRAKAHICSTFPATQTHCATCSLPAGCREQLVQTGCIWRPCWFWFVFWPMSQQQGKNVMSLRSFSSYTETFQATPETAKERGSMNLSLLQGCLVLISVHMQLIWKK